MKSRTFIVSWIGIAVAVIGVVVPILWEMYKETSAIEVQHLGSAVLVGAVEGVEELKITYRNEPVPRVSKLDFFVTNASRHPIRGEDFVSPLRLSVGSDSRILDARVQRVVPSDLEVASALAPDSKSVSLRFSLLNPGDGTQLTLFVAGPPGSNVSASGRIAGVRDVRFVDNSTAASVWRRIPESVWVVGGFVLFGIALVLWVTWHVGAEAQATKMWKAGVAILSASTPAEYLAAISLYTAFKGVKLDSTIKRLLTLPLDRILTDEQRRAIDARIRAAMITSSPQDIYGPLAVVAVPTVAGIAFVLSKLASL